MPSPSNGSGFDASPVGDNPIARAARRHPAFPSPSHRAGDLDHPLKPRGKRGKRGDRRTGEGGRAAPPSRARPGWPGRPDRLGSETTHPQRTGCQGARTGPFFPAGWRMAPSRVKARLTTTAQISLRCDWCGWRFASCSDLDPCRRHAQQGNHRLRRARRNRVSEGERRRGREGACDMGETKNAEAGFDPRGEVYPIDDIPAELVAWCKANPDRFVSVRDADGKVRKVAYCECARYPMREDGTRCVVYDHKWLMTDGRNAVELSLSIADALGPGGRGGHAVAHVEARGAENAAIASASRRRSWARGRGAGASAPCPLHRNPGSARNRPRCGKPGTGGRAFHIPTRKGLIGSRCAHGYMESPPADAREGAAAPPSRSLPSPAWAAGSPRIGPYAVAGHALPGRTHRALPPGGRSHSAARRQGAARNLAQALRCAPRLRRLRAPGGALRAAPLTPLRCMRLGNHRLRRARRNRVPEGGSQALAG